MADFLIYTKENRERINKASSVLITPYVYNSDIKRYVLGFDTFDVYSIIGDTLSIEQDGNNLTPIKNQYTGNPVIFKKERSTYTFKAECLDFQLPIMQLLYDTKVAMVGGTIDTKSFAITDDTQEFYCCIQVLFKDKGFRIVIPKVCMNNNTSYSSMKSSFAKNIISGTVMPTYFSAFKGDSIIQFLNSNSSEYVTHSHYVKLNNNFNFGVYHSHEEDAYYLSKYDTKTNETGRLVYVVDANNGDFNIVSLYSNNF